MLTQKTITEQTEWKRINMRNVDHLLGVEFIHDLYNRYEPKINAIRFRNTITVWKDGVVNSYAPMEEWDQLGKTVSLEYYSLNPNIIKYTRKLYQRKREDFHLFIKNIAKSDIKSLTEEELVSRLLNFQSLVLGELYVLNFVQVEHGLNIAVKRVISDLGLGAERENQIFSKLIQTDIPTESQKDKFKLRIMAKILKPFINLGLISQNIINKIIMNYHERNKYLYSAYGENPPSIDITIATFKKYLGEKERLGIRVWPKLLSRESKNTLKELSNHKLNILVPLLIRGGIFRDKNKALLGRSMRYRFEILDEISIRGLEDRNNLNYYLMSELIDLIKNKVKISRDIIESRIVNGVTLERREKISTGDETPRNQSENLQPEKIYGQCASRGECEGICRIVISKDDAHKVNVGDIMIAIGTDFDVIDAMYRSAAVITEEGGILSHASVVCREIKKPCCIAVRDATKILRDGQKIKVDATRGEITIIQ